MSQPSRVKCTYEDCSFYFETEKEMIRHKKKEPDHFYCHKCGEDYENDTEYMIHQILSPKHTVCPSCGMEFKSVSGRDRHVEISHSSSQRLPCRGCGINFTRAASLMQHIEKDQCRVIRRADFVNERAERAVIKDAIGKELQLRNEDGAVRMSSITSASSGGSSSLHGGVSVLPYNPDQDENQQPIVNSSVLMNSTLSATSLNNFPALPAARVSRASVSSQGAHRAGGGGSVTANDVSDRLATVSLNKDSVWNSGQGHGHIFAQSDPFCTISAGTDSKYDQLSEVPFRENGSQTGGALSMLEYSSRVEREQRDQSVPPPAPRFPERNEHVTTQLPPRVSRLDTDKFFDPIMRCYICPAVKCQGKFATAEAFRAHVHGPSHSAGDVICSTCLRRFKTTTALMSHMESGTKRCNARNTTNYNQLLREVSAGLIGTSGQLEDGSVRYSVPTDEGWGENPNTLTTRW